MDESSRQKGETSTQSPKEGAAFAAPRIALSPGGGAIRGLGEKFAVHLVTGTGSPSPYRLRPAREDRGLDRHSLFRTILVQATDQVAADGLWRFPPFPAKPLRGCPKTRTHPNPRLSFFPAQTISCRSSPRMHEAYGCVIPKGNEVSKRLLALLTAAPSRCAPCSRTPSTAW